jgi:TRAP-type C4-dicarboxylate transport system substrate-binding protein
MVRKSISTLSVVAVLILFAMSAQAAELNLRLGHPAPVTSAHHKWAQQFADNFKKLSSGTIQTEVIGGGVLGNPKQQLAQLRAGKLDLWWIDITAPMFAKEAKHFSVLMAPFLFRDQAHYRKFLDGDVYKEMINDAEQKVGFKYLGIAGDRAPRSLSTVKRPIKSPDEMKGLKMRVPGLPFVSQTWKAWGASPTPVRGADIYQALQSGMVDGDDNGMINLFERGLLEVLRYHTPINYVHSGIGIYMSAHTWAKLTAQQRGWAQKAVSMLDEERKPYSEAMALYFAKAKAKGIKIVEPEMDKFRGPAAEVVAEFDGKFWPKGLYKKIQDIR